MILENTWRPFEWDIQEAKGIHSLATCLLNYLTQEIPDEIKNLSYWHGESLVLAFNDNSNKNTPLSDIVISYAEHAVSHGSKSGFYFLLRPSSRVASSKNAIIFTMTYNVKNGIHSNQILHSRVEAIQNPKNQQWLFKYANSQNPGMTLNHLLLSTAKGLPIIPVSTPKTVAMRVNTYIELS